jgi:UDP-N-acetylglucosamine 2-epimerase (non-hydrolysing)
VVANRDGLFKVVDDGPRIYPSERKKSTFREPRPKVLTLFGTRPEIIKLAPVIRALERTDPPFRTINIASGQHTDLLYPLVHFFDVRLDHDLKVMEPGQTLNGVCCRVLETLAPILADEAPDLVLVQGDTVTAFAGALCAFFQGIPVGHVEAGLRSGNPLSPFPEEMNRRLITQIARYHFAATARNHATLLAEGVDPANVFLTGNPVVDSLKNILARQVCSPLVRRLLRDTQGYKRIVLTTHRRESFGELLAANLEAMRAFVDRHDDLALLFPVHPNPAVRGPATALLSGHDRIKLLEPLDYMDFTALLASAWLLVSDSGGVQEEAPTLGKPLLVLRDNTERPEALESGVARLVGGCPERLRAMLEEAYQDSSWAERVVRTESPFGSGDSGERIVRAIEHVLAGPQHQREAA